jgi:hypothetical protein
MEIKMPSYLVSLAWAVRPEAPALLACGVAFAAGLGGCGGGPRMIVPSSAVMRTNGTSPYESEEVLLDLGRGRIVRGRIDVTTKGNGQLHILNISPSIVDDHDDGDLFEGQMLRVSAVDVDGDGRRDLVLFGTRIVTDDDGHAVSRHNVAAVFTFRPEDDRFVEFAGSPWE